MIISACNHGSLKLVKLCIEYDKISPMTSLIEAIFSGQLHIVKYLLESGTDFECIKSPVLASDWLIQNHPHLVKYLQEYKSES